MKKLLKITALILTLTLLAIPFTACSKVDISETASAMGLSAIIGEKTDAGPVNAFVIAIQATQNSVDPDLYLNLKNITDMIFSWSSAGSICAVISVSGSPQIVDTILVPESDAVTQQQIKDDQEFWGSKIIALASEVTAAADEVDTLGALTKAGGWLRDQRADNKYILYIGSGIATQNELFSFTNSSLISADHKSVSTGLNERNALPDLSDVTVYFAGIGCTEQPQSPVGTSTKARIATLYESIIVQAGGSFSQIYTELGGRCADSEYYVTLIDFAAEESISFAEPVSFTQDEIRFRGDSAEYVDPAAAQGVLRPYAQQIIDHELRILLAGFVAGNGTEGFSYTLSLDRAQAVYDSFVSLGVNANQITVVGLGGGGGERWHTPDTDRSNGLIEECAKLNRRVVMALIDSDDAKELLELSGAIAQKNGYE